MRNSSMALIALLAAAVLPIAHVASGADAALDPSVAAGKIIFEETAGGVGCMSCHGQDATGDFGPDIVGMDAAMIQVQLESNENMTFIELTDEEVEQVAAYLAYLAGN